MAETAQQILSSVKTIKGQDEGSEILSNKNQATYSGAFVGLAFGLYWGYAKKHNMLMTGIVGAMGGAVVARLFMPN